MIQLNTFGQCKIQVLDKYTKEPVVFANVYYPDLKTGTITNENGVFTINIQAPTLLIQISAVGYKTYLEITKLQSEKQTIYLEPSTHELQEIVVLGSSSKLQGENVQNVETLNLSNNTEVHGFSLSEKLSSVAGVQNLSTGIGIGKPVVRGLSGNRIAVFSQGIRIENQQWGDEHGLGLDELGFEQVEIIKGPASLLYGSDALGGVLYFSEERYASENTIDAILASEYNSNTNGLRNTAGIKFSKNRFHWNAFGGYTTHKDYKDGNQDFVNNSRFNTATIKTSLAYTADKFVSSLKYSFLNENYGLTEVEDSTHSHINKYTPSLPYQHLVTHIISSENTLFLKNESILKVDLGYVFNNRQEFEISENELSEAALDMNLNTGSYNAKWYFPKMKERWQLIVGSQGMVQTNINKGEEVLVPDATTFDIGAFITSDYYYSKNSYWQMGLRLDGRHIEGKYGSENEENYIPYFSKGYTAFNFSTGIYHQLIKQLSLRANLSSGYRAPNMFELLSDGVHEGTNRYEIGNTNLKTENSYQIDASLSYKNAHLELFINPYFNYIRNYIYLNPSGEIKDGLPVYYYTQIDAYLYGGETGFHFHPHPLDWLHIDGNYSTTFGKDKSQNNLPLIPSHKINTSIRAIFPINDFIERFYVYIQDEYSLAQNHVAEYELTTNAYNLVNAGLGFEFKFRGQKLLFNAVVNNIFNKVYYDHLSRYKTEGIYNIGRNINLKLTIPLHWKMKSADET